MDISITIISGVLLISILVYVIKEISRRKSNTSNVETNYDIKTCLIFYLITTGLIVGFHIAYYINSYPSNKQLAFFFAGLGFLIFPLISYLLARKKLIATKDKLIIYRLFYKKELPIKDIAKIKRTALTCKIYAKNELLISMDVRYYVNVRVFLNFIKEQSGCVEDTIMIHGLNDYNQLKFLERYNFKVENHSNERYTEICLIHDNVCIVYHEWPQFGDCIIFVSNSLQDYRNHEYLRTYNLNWFINNVKANQKNGTKKSYSFIELVKLYIENQLANNNPIFEVKISKT